MLSRSTHRNLDFGKEDSDETMHQYIRRLMESIIQNTSGITTCHMSSPPSLHKQKSYPPLSLFSLSKKMKFIAFLFVFLLSAKADESLTIEPPDSRVNVLSYNNFDRFIQRNELILMEFYAPWCGHCQQLAAPYREAAEQLENLDLPRKVKLAKYNDGDEYNRQLRAGAPDMYNYTSYPSLFVFDKGEHTPYYGGRTAEDIVFYMTAVAKGLDPHEEELKTKPGLYKDKPEFSKWVTDFQDEELFEEQIWKNSENKLRVVEYYSDRCPFCQSLAKEYVEAASIVTEKFPGKVQFHGVNSRIFYDIAETQGITGYPWVSFYYKGEKVEDMAGLGGADSIVNWVSEARGCSCMIRFCNSYTYHVSCITYHVNTMSCYCIVMIGLTAQIQISLFVVGQ